MSQNPGVLIIEDQPQLRATLEQALAEGHYDVVATATGEEGITLYLEKRPDLVILDLSLPGRDGLEVLGLIRSYGFKVPVLILTARDSVEDRVTGLDKGADDYLTKPFALSELLARVRALIRRFPGSATGIIEVDDLRLDIMNHQVSRSGKEIELTPKEYQLLQLLMQNIHMPVSRKTIASCLWNVNRVTPLDNVTDVHMMRLRKKIDGSNQKKLIHTRRGLGFVLTDKTDD